MDEQADVIAFLANPATHGGQPVERIDTHGAHVFLVGDRAYKLKRAVHFPYMDFSTVERRRAVCAAELLVNRRTAPTLYLRTASITRERNGLAFDGAGPVLDWVVVMRRFDGAALFDRLAAAGKLDVPLVQKLATVVANFHAAAEIHRRVDPVAHLRQVVEVAGAEMQHHVPEVFAATLVASVTQRLNDMLARGADLIAARSAAGHVRRLHGDLHLRNICLCDGVPTLFDAIEFNDDIAIIDRLYDLAFLLMDLVHGRRRDLANAALNTYLRHPEDDDGLRLLPLFLALRAAIRAHVGASAAATAGAAAARHQAEVARGYLSLAQDLAAPPPPRLLAVGGYSGTGKSTVARGLAPMIGAAPGAVVLRSDEIRKILHGVGPTERLPPEAYRAAVSRRVYATLLQRAERILRAGHAVIADALFLSPADRAAVEQVAMEAGVAFQGLWLTAPAELLAARVEARRNDASDATLAVLRQQLETPPGPMDWRILDASPPPASVLQAAFSAAGCETGGEARSIG